MQNAMSETVKQPTYDDATISIADELRDAKQTLNRVQDLLEEDMRTIEDRRGGQPEAE